MICYILSVQNVIKLQDIVDNDVLETDLKTYNVYKAIKG